MTPDQYMSHIQRLELLNTILVFYHRLKAHNLRQLPQIVSQMTTEELVEALDNYPIYHEICEKQNFKYMKSVLNYLSSGIYKTEALNKLKETRDKWDNITRDRLNKKPQDNQVDNKPLTEKEERAKERRRETKKRYKLNRHQKQHIEIQERFKDDYIKKHGIDAYLDYLNSQKKNENH